MMATPHMLAGAAIGKVLRRPWLAWPVAFGTHFLLDFTPHLDEHAMFGVEHGGPTPVEATTAILNFLLGLVLVGWLVWRQPDRRVTLGGAIFAILIDVIEKVPPLGPWSMAWPGTAWLTEFHHAFQHNVTPAQWPLGIGTQVAVVVLSLAVLLSRRPAPANSVAGGGS
jgi:hypothetical protein